MWSTQDDMYIALWDQIYPPDVKYTRWHVHCIMRSDIPPRCEVHMMTCTLHYEIRYTPRLWYFNDHITALVISEKILYDIYWGYKETNQDFPSILQQIHIYRHGNIRYGKSMKQSYIYLHMNKSVYIHYRITVWILWYIPRISLMITETSINIYMKKHIM